MPKTDGDAQGGGNPENRPGEQAQTGSESSANADEFFVGRWKSKDEAEKGVSEQVKKITEQGQQLSELKREMESLKNQSALSAAVLQLAEATKHSKEDTRPSVDDWTNDIAKDLESDPQAAAKRIVQLAAGWSAEVERKAVSEISELKKQLATEMAKAQETILRSSSDYAQHRDAVDRLVTEAGLPLAKAIDTAKAMRALYAGQGLSFEPPAPTTGNAGASSGAGKSAGKKGGYLSDKERTELTGTMGLSHLPPLDANDLAEMEAIQQREVERKKREEEERQ